MFVRGNVLFIIRWRVSDRPRLGAMVIKGASAPAVPGMEEGSREREVSRVCG